MFNPCLSSTDTGCSRPWSALEISEQAPPAPNTAVSTAINLFEAGKPRGLGIQAKKNKTRLELAG